MRELSLHIMDIAENGLSAGATLIDISVKEDTKENWLLITIMDNGCGMSDEMQKRILDPFFTTKTTRRVGLGLSMFQQLSQRCDGQFNIKSAEGEGTTVSASFRLNHIDLAPLGDMAGSLASLIMGHSKVDFIYTHEKDGQVFHLDTRQVKETLDGVSITHPEVVKSISKLVRESLEALSAGAHGSLSGQRA